MAWSSPYGCISAEKPALSVWAGRGTRMFTISFMAFGALIAISGLLLFLKDATTPGQTTARLPFGIEVTINAGNSILIVVIGAILFSLPFTGALRPPLIGSEQNTLLTNRALEAPATNSTVEDNARSTTDNTSSGSSDSGKNGVISGNEVAEPTASVANNFPEKYTKPNGLLYKSGDDWFETDDTNGMRIAWREVRRDKDETILYDASRRMYLRVPTSGGEVTWSFVNPISWTGLYYAAPATS